MSDKIKPSRGPFESGGCVVYNADGKVIADLASPLVSNGLSPDETEGNARLIAAAPDMYGAAHFAKAALATLDAYEADGGGPLDDMHELGRIHESSGMPSFRIRVGHIRRLAAAIAKATGA